VGQRDNVGECKSMGILAIASRKKSGHTQGRAKKKVALACERLGAFQTEKIREGRNQPLNSLQTLKTRNHESAAKKKPFARKWVDVRDKGLISLNRGPAS